MLWLVCLLGPGTWTAALASIVLRPTGDKLGFVPFFFCMMLGHGVAGCLFLAYCLERRAGLFRSPMFWLFVVYWGSVGAIATSISLRVSGQKAPWLEELVHAASYGALLPVALIPLLGGARWLRSRLEA